MTVLGASVFSLNAPLIRATNPKHTAHLRYYLVVERKHVQNPDEKTGDEEKKHSSAFWSELYLRYRIMSLSGSI